MRLLIFFFSLISFSLLSCKYEIEVNFPEQEIKPVVNCLFSPNNPIKIHVSLSKLLSDTSTFLVNNALVSLIGTDGTYSNLIYIGDGFYSNNDFILQKGVCYSLEVEISGFKKLTASSCIPSSASRILQIQSFSGYKTEPVTGTGEDPTIPVQNVKLLIKEDSTVIDYFGISVIQNMVVTGIDSKQEVPNEYFMGYYWGSNDPIITSEGLEHYNADVFMFRDISFINQTEEIEFYVSKDFESAYWLRFFNFSPEAFQYVKSWFIHDYTQDYDFWEVYEPQPLYSNIKNGYGIFAGYSMQLYEVYPDSTSTFE